MALPGVNLMVIYNGINVTIDNLSFQDNWGNGARGIYVWGKGNNVTIKNCKFKNIGWSQSRTATIPPGFGAHAILVLGNKNAGSYTNTKISGNTITDCITGYSESITMAGNVDGFMVEDNVITNNTNIGIDIAGHFPWVRDWDTNEVILPALNQARNGTIRGNTVTKSISLIAASAGIYCDGCRNVTIERNLLVENAAGISIGCEVGGNKTASKVKVLNNIIRDSKVCGLFLGSLSSELSSQGPSYVDSCEVRNNTFYKNSAQPTFYVGGTNDYAVFLQNSRFNTFTHNILFLNDATKGIVSASASNVANFTLDYNLFFRPNDEENNLVDSYGTPIIHGPNAYYQDPEFSSLTTFKLKNWSGAVNSGKPSVVLTPNEKDRAGSNRKFSTTRVDIGALESTSTIAGIAPNLIICDGVLNPQSSRIAFQSLPDDSLTVYPNPTTEQLNFRFEESPEEEVTVQVVDSFGLILQ